MTPSRRELLLGAAALVACGPSSDPKPGPPTSPVAPATGTVVRVTDTLPGDTGPRDTGSSDTGPRDTGPDTHSGDSAVDSPPDTGSPVDPDAPQCSGQKDPPPKTCSPTSQIGEGPFYKEGCPEQTDMNPEREAGTPMIVHVRALDGACQPHAGLRVEVWHAAQDTRYDDDGYQARGHGVTDADGRICFSTLYPGVYTEVSTGLPLPAHLHWRFYLPDGTIWTTMFNFEGDPALEYTFHEEDIVCALVPSGSGYVVTKDVVIA